MRIFLDRADAGLQLAKLLEGLKSEDPIVFGLPRGGVVVAKAVADQLQAPLDIVVARKIGHPGNPEYALGAVTADGSTVFGPDERFRVSPEWIAEESARQLAEATRREQLYRMGRATISPKGKTAILVDDGIATGYTMEAAVASLRRLSPRKIIVAVPVAPPDIVQRFALLADQVVVAEIPDVLYAVGQFYRDFGQVDDEQVIRLLEDSGP